MNESQLGILLAGISSILGVLIYFTKNIKESECLGSRCTQAVELEKGLQETII